jgi:serine protease Do
VRLLAATFLAAALLSCQGKLEVSTSSAPSATVALTPSAAPPPPRPSAYAQPESSAVLPGGARAPISFAELAQHADPAVVFVETEQAVFGAGRRIVGEGLGSGFVFDPSGLILTNHHVIANATRIDIVFGGGRRLRAKVAGIDPPTDVAILRVEATKLPHLAFGDSSALRVGDWVLAIGNPFGLSHTVSAGILSAKGRTRKDVQGLDPSGYYDFLQTDASINPGNSGGPLLDLSGRVIGINTAIKPQANSIGFAIPIDMVEELLPSLLELGEVRRSALGAVVATLKSEDIKRLGVSAGADGALLTRVVPGGPADRAGLKPDDVIVGFADVAGPSPHRLRWLVSIAGVGRTVTLKVLREHRTLDVRVTLGALAKRPEADPELEGFPFP